MNNKNLQQRRLDATPRGVGVMCDFMPSRQKTA